MKALIADSRLTRGHITALEILECALWALFWIIAIAGVVAFFAPIWLISHSLGFAFHRVTYPR